MAKTSTLGIKNRGTDDDLQTFEHGDAGLLSAFAAQPASVLAAHALSDIPSDSVLASLVAGGQGRGGFFENLAAVIGNGSSRVDALSDAAFLAPVQISGGPSDGGGPSDAPAMSGAEAMGLIAKPATATVKIVGGTVPQQDLKALYTAADIPTDSMFSQQWNLKNTGQNGAVAGVDINVLGAWHMGYSGKGVSVGVYDTAMDVTNADISKNIDLSKIITSSMVPDRAYVDPTKIVSSALDSHATAVAGIIGASKGDGGVVGIAYNAKMTPVDILGAQSGNYGWEATWLMKNFDITNNSWGFTTPFSVGQLDASSQYWVLSGFKTAADQGRGGLGTIVNLAAGNYRQTGMTTELTGPTVDRHAVVVGATDDHGFVSYYSNGGASLLTVAPSSGLYTGITTTDVSGAMGYSSGNYTSTFGGTSAATPELSGIEALMLEANPMLGWRDVQDILALASRHVGSAIGANATGYEQDTWQFNHATNVNGGGMHFSNDYGFGLIDATAAVSLAQTWNVVHQTAGTSANEVALSSTYSGASLDVGHGHTTTLSFNIGAHESVQSAVLDLSNLTFNHANNLTITLTSPTGTVSELLMNNGGSSAQITAGWELMSREFLGEDAFGTWKVTITDSNASDVGSLSSAKLTLYGSSIANNSVAYYTDEFVTYANADPSRAQVGSAITAIDAAAVSGATNVNLSTKVASIDGKAIAIGATTNISTVIGGAGDDVLVANNFGNKLFGGQGNDIISGGQGADYIDGGSGSNIINTGAGADQVALHKNGVDTIVDFAIGVDKLLLSKTEFAAFLGQGTVGSDFVAGTASTHVAGGGLVYNQSTGSLWYDADGASALTLIAQLSNHAALKTTDILLV